MSDRAYIAISPNYARLQHTHLLVGNVDVNGFRKFFNRIAQVILHMPRPPFGSPLLVRLLPKNLLMQLHHEISIE